MTPMRSTTPGPLDFVVRYIGPDFPELHDHEFRIVAVRRPMPPPEEPLMITSNDELLALGRLTAMDRLDVVHLLAGSREGELHKCVPPKHFSAFARIDTDGHPGSHED